MIRYRFKTNSVSDPRPIVDKESTQECSVCHAEQMGTMLNDNYCPNCGAKMDEVAEND